MVKWGIYYGDGTTFSNEDGGPEVAPPLNVQVIASYPNCWRCGDLFGLMDYLMRPGWKVVLFGRTISNEKNKHINELARNDPDLDRRRYIDTSGDFYWYEENPE